MKTIRNMKRTIFCVCLSMVILLSSGTIVYAAQRSYTYPNGYVMKYDAYKAAISGSSGAAAYTQTENEAIAFVALFSSKNGVAKNSGTKEQDFYVYLGITGNGGTAFKSVHSLKYPNENPIGDSKKIEF